MLSNVSFSLTNLYFAFGLHYSQHPAIKRISSVRLLRIASAIIPLYRGKKHAARVRRGMRNGAGNGTTERCQLTIIIHVDGTTPPVYGCDSRTIPGVANPVCLAADSTQLNSTQLDSTRLGSTPP